MSTTPRQTGEATHCGAASHGSSDAAAQRMTALAAELFPWRRSITGDGLRRTLRRLAELMPLAIEETPSGAMAFDLQIPQEWSIGDAYVADASGQRVIDYRSSNLHVVAYSRPVRASMTWAELEPHLHSLPEHPEWIPYRTAYFRNEWGFCLADRLRRELAARGAEQRYDVCVASELTPGSLTYGECFLPGSTDDEVLLTAHVCHPSLANDNLSAVVVAVELARRVAAWPHRRLSYRFLFAPATIGALAWLSRNSEAAQRVRHGLVLALLGDAGPLTYKRSRRNAATIDRAAECLLRQRGDAASVRPFEPWGYDERQFCSPGFDLPMGRLTRTPPGEFPEYHTSADDLRLLDARALEDSLAFCTELLELLEYERPLVRTQPFGEPRLDAWAAYRSYGRGGADPQLQRTLLWLLNLADGTHSMTAMMQRSEAPWAKLRQAADLALEHGWVRWAETACGA